MKALHMLAVGMFFGLALLLAAFLGADHRDIAIMAALSSSMLPLLAVSQNRRGASCCWTRRAKPADQMSV